MTKVQDKCWRTTVTAALALLFLGYSTSHADITLDGTLGGPSGPLTGPNYEIPAAVGEQVGSNLFHSFGVFNINTDESATFTGPNGIENVLGRVTGDSSSIIDGRLSSEIPGANLYLINPNGVVFGENAQLDVKGSFHASTADYVRLGQDGVFSATDPETSTLTVAPPSAFGFLDANPAAISMNGSHLEVPQGAPFSLVGGDIHVAGGGISAPGGRINLASVASPGEVNIVNGNLSTDPNTRMGNITVSQDASIDASGEGGGSISIRGGQLTVANSAVDAMTTGSSDGGGIIINLTGGLIISNGDIRTITSGSGDAGAIVLKVANLRSTSGSFIDSGTNSTGRAGDLTINATGSLSIRADESGGGLFSNTFSDGNGGRISIIARSLLVDNGLVLSGNSDDTGNANGDAGDINVEVQNLKLTNGGQISANSSSAGHAGNLTITAMGPVVIMGRNGDFLSGLFSSTSGEGDGGNIHVSAHALNMRDGIVLSNTVGNGNAGDIVLEVENLALRAGAHIDSSTTSAGDAGDLTVKPARLVLISGHGSHDNPSGLFSNTFGDGDAGQLTIHAENLKMQDGYITAGSHSSGSGGNVLIQAGHLTLTDTAQIDSTAQGSGHGGNVKVIAMEGITIKGGPLDRKNPTGIFNNSNSTGAAGDLTITTQGALVMRGGRILTRTLGDADAGIITIKARDLKLIDGAQIFSGIGNAQSDGTVIGSKNGKGTGGDIKITATGTLSISGSSSDFDSGLFTNAQTGQGDAGDIDVHAGRLNISNGGRIGSDTRFDARGDAGYIVLKTGTLNLSRGGQVFATSNTSGGAGNINVTTPGDIIITGRLEDADSLKQSGIFSNANRSGPAGKLTITTDSALVMDDSLIQAQTAGVANGGIIKVQARNLTLTGGAQISSSILDQGLSGKGSGGNVIVTTGDTLSISGSNVDSGPSGLFSRSEVGQGDAGDVSVSAGNLIITDDGTISTESGGDSRGNAGDIVIDIAETAQLTNSSIEAAARKTDGGNITLTAGSTQLTDGSEITSSVRGNPKTTGGTLTFNGGSLIMLDGSRAKATATQGNGGFIQVNSQAFLHDGKLINVLNTRSRRGNDGTVEVNTPDTDIAGSISRLPISFLNAAALLSQRCAARTAEDTSSFVIIGRGGVPRGPDDWSLGSYGSEGGGSEAVNSELASNKRTGTETFHIAENGPLMLLKLECAKSSPSRL